MDKDCPAVSTHTNEPLRNWERAAVLAFLALVVVFGYVVEMRSAYLSQRRTDFGVYLRAAWAVRSGEDIYSVTDEHGWHYCYPPLPAILFVPLAEPPAGAETASSVPFEVSVALWYALSVFCVFLAVHWFVSGLGTAPSGRRWWYARTWPIYLLTPSIGCTLSRGQINLLLLLTLAGWFRAAATGRTFRSGLWLAGAICLKLIPAFLLLVPLWRRDGRALLGLAVGLVIGFGIIPAAVWGVPGALRVNERFFETMIEPALGPSGDHARDDELMEVNATDNQSFVAVIHNYRHWTTPRPRHADMLTKAAHLLIAGTLTLITLAATGWRRSRDPWRLLLLIGCLTLLMVLTSPVSHMHYFCLAMPLVVALFASPGSAQRGGMLPGPAAMSVLLLAATALAFAEIPLWERRRDAGIPMYASLLLWGAAVYLLRKSRAQEAGPIACASTRDESGGNSDTGKPRKIVGLTAPGRKWFDFVRPGS